MCFTSLPTLVLKNVKFYLSSAWDGTQSLTLGKCSTLTLRNSKKYDSLEMRGLDCF